MGRIAAGPERRFKRCVGAVTPRPPKPREIGRGPRAPIARSRLRVASKRLGATLEGMKPTAMLHESGQSLWLDNISREMLDSGQLRLYIDEYSVTGLTSNPSIFNKAIASGAYDGEIRKAAEDPEELFFELAIEDLRRAAD